ncbi:S1 family peptidase [Mycolicibacterium fortuitum]|uniref:S1 family peptidase n=1 Tax=Mycolicibacterium fortuitum TaxID=1766 RepID=A0AAE4VGB1_MYCFO|nr:S1 family peptidase [Mycolicibacterium fortuitum]MDV7193195.1 S1 family peptidase [Mycolicibacterium fortuitum]MDV7206500.1 S1 family peptidase [Mycolicibacterium fortuitum]MDV7228026.1 S1 family peptidase [Mycolicibacterium fortuitum]MDV7260327.1 S1 family peptidase [Mycolicibacterium fortuitum]MDV7285071.1 S1 family peptidase [Mycolicibacterium fortuitum]
MSRRNGFAIAAVAAAAVALSACSTATGGAPVTPTGNPSVSASVKGAEAADPSAEVESTWLTIPATQADAAPKRIELTQTASGARCTAGPAIAAASTPTRRGFVAAGHCDEAPGSAVSAGGESIEPYTDTRRGDRGVTVTWGAANAAPTVAGGFKVAGVLKQDVVQRLEYGTPVCMDGAVSGVRCGTVTENDASGIYVKLPIERGDSGAPLFLVSDRGTATLIGIVEQRSGNFTFGAYLDPLLAEVGAKVLTDRTAAIDPRTDPRYSDAVTVAQ